MKTLIISLFIFSNYSFSQTKFDNTTETDTVNVFIDSDFDFSSSASDSRSQSNATTGTLGLKFEQRFIYGSAHFTVFSKNQQIETIDSTEQKLFGTNLLLPQNNSGNISNFHFNFGTSSFTRLFAKDVSDANMISWRSIGANINYSLNNTKWVKDSLTLPLFINSFSFNLTYDLLNLKLLGDNGDRIKLRLHYGYVARRIGGDFGLDNNIANREVFLNSSKLSFNGTQYGARLEIGKFYGQANVTCFSKKDGIDGFSGYQAVISLGVIADLNILAKQYQPKYEILKRDKNKEK
jgi:hypothetical protein